MSGQDRYYSNPISQYLKRPDIVSRSYGMLSGTWPVDSIYREDLATVSLDGPNIFMLVGCSQGRIRTYNNVTILQGEIPFSHYTLPDYFEDEKSSVL